MFMSVTLESAVFKGKNYSDTWHSIKNTKDLTMKQNVRHIFEIGVRTTWDLWSEKQLIGKIIRGNIRL